MSDCRRPSHKQQEASILAARWAQQSHLLGLLSSGDSKPTGEAEQAAWQLDGLNNPTFSSYCQVETLNPLERQSKQLGSLMGSAIPPSRAIVEQGKVLFQLQVVEVARKGSLCLFVLVVHRIVMPTSSERRQGRKSLAMQAKFKLNRDYLIRFHHHSSLLLCQQATRGKRKGNFSPYCNIKSYHYLLQPTTCRLCCNLESYYYLLQPSTCRLCDQKTTPKQCRWKVQSKG